MDLQTFGRIVRERIPSPTEFVAVVKGQGWQIAKKADGSAALVVKDKADQLARALARMLSREPYRTNVLLLVSEAMDRQDEMGETPVPVEKPKPPQGRRLVFWRMKSGQVLYRIQEEGEGERLKPPYGADAVGDSDSGPWRELDGRWLEEDGRLRWEWHGNDQGRSKGA